MAQQAWVQQWNRARRPPRRSKTAFACFIRSNYHTVRGRLGTRKPQVVYRACAQLWRNMNLEDRIRYTVAAEQDRVRYFKERDEWARKFSGRVPRIRRSRKARDAPKRPRNPFILYRIEHWKAASRENPGSSQQDLTRYLAKQWRTVPEATKEHYRQLCVKERERYAMEMAEYRYQQAEINGDRQFENFEARIESLRIRDAFRRRRQEIERKLLEERIREGRR